MKENKVNISIEKEEALVLFEFLSRFDQTDKIQFEDQAEKIVLWNLYSLLEATLTEPLQKDYEQIIRQARRHIKGVE